MPTTDYAERAYRCVDYQTTVVQPPGVKPATIYLALCDHGNCPRQAVHDGIQECLDEDRLMAWRDAAGELRLTPKTEAKLRRVLGRFNANEAPAEKCEQVAAAIAEVQR